MTRVLPDDDQPPPMGNLDAADLGFLTVVFGFAVTLVIVQASVFMHGRSNFTAGTLAALSFASWAYIHSWGRSAP
jgi:hypothetical protein